MCVRLCCNIGFIETNKWLPPKNLVFLLANCSLLLVISLAGNPLTAYSLVSSSLKNKILTSKKQYFLQDYYSVHIYRFCFVPILYVTPPKPWHDFYSLICKVWCRELLLFSIHTAEVTLLHIVQYPGLLWISTPHIFLQGRNRSENVPEKTFIKLPHATWGCYCIVKLQHI